MMMKHFFDNKELLVNDGHKDKMIELINTNFDKWKTNYTKIKSIYSMCLPYKSPHLRGLK